MDQLDPKKWGDTPKECAPSYDARSHSKAVALTPQELNQLLEKLPRSARQIRRLVLHLASGEKSTVSCNVKACSVNLSDLSIKYGGRLFSAGFVIKCRYPKIRLKNRYGEDTNMVYWGIYRLQKVENAA